ncbi:MAG TPA: hypothetical protein VFI31_19825 [Pirellulales bacterium]|nr:hypothetical protein [Pirellulales bacterium]
MLSSAAVDLAAGLDVNIFAQIGFVVLIALERKNAIVMVKFAKVEPESGADEPPGPAHPIGSNEILHDGR